MATTDRDIAVARQGRLAALVIAATMTLWLAAQWLGPVLGLPGRYAFLFDFAALAGFIWALVLAVQIWRARREDG